MTPTPVLTTPLISPGKPGNEYGYTESGLGYLMNNADSYLNAYNQEKAWARDDLIRQQGYKREDEAYDRLFETLKKNGINPALAMSSVGSYVGQASGQSASTFKNSTAQADARAEAANNAKVVGSIIAAFALIVAAAL